MSILAFEHTNDEQAAPKLTADALFCKHAGTRPYALAYLHGLDVAPYKFPDQIVVVRDIPRDAYNRVLSEQILTQI